MRLNDLDIQEIEATRIRELQARFPVEHQALTNWGEWAQDLRRMFPSRAQCHVFDQYKYDETEEYGVITPETQIAEQTESAKAEREESEDYDEKSAIALDERIHGYGGLAEYLRICIRTAYVDGGSREARWYLFANCSVPDQFLERLEAALVFVGRFA